MPPSVLADGRDYRWVRNGANTFADAPAWLMQGHDEYYENVEGKRFVKKSREFFPKTPWGSMGIKVFDFDNDADMDILLRPDRTAWKFTR